MDVHVKGDINKKMTARFYDWCEIDPEATKEAGREIYRDVPFVLLCSRNGKRKIPKKATPEVIREYPDEWAAYQDKQLEGKTHLSLIGLRPSQVMDMNYYGIDSVEALARTECPEIYQPFKKVAEMIAELRREETENERVRSDRDGRNGGQNIRVAPVQQTENGGGGIERNGPGGYAGTSEEGLVQITYDFNL